MARGQKFKPLKHGARFVMRVPGGSTVVVRLRARVFGVDADRAIREGWAYSILCSADTEGLTWARGWNTKAARALRVACAL